MSAMRKPSLLERAAARYDYAGTGAAVDVVAAPPAPAREVAPSVPASEATTRLPVKGPSDRWLLPEGWGENAVLASPGGAARQAAAVPQSDASSIVAPIEPSVPEAAAEAAADTVVARPPEPVAQTVATPVVVQVEPAVPEGDAAADTLAAIPAEFLAHGDEDAEPVFPTPDPGVALVDRGMLAEHGMIVPGAPVGALAEEFRLVKRQLLVTRKRIAQSDGRRAGDGSPEAGAKARTVLVCSARPHDGKTFCAVNLALSLAAERDLHVLLVDADVAKPDVPARLGLTDAPGLLDALADPAVDVEDLVRATDVPQLSILTAGTRTTTDTELLASARTRTVLQRLLDADPRRIVIFDSPPALAASPSGVLAMLVGQVMLVVRADRTPENDLRQAVQLLDGCEHIQLMLNAVSFVPGGQRYGYYGQDAA